MLLNLSSIFYLIKVMENLVGKEGLRPITPFRFYRNACLRNVAGRRCRAGLATQFNNLPHYHNHSRKEYCLTRVKYI